MEPQVYSPNAPADFLKELRSQTAASHQALEETGLSSKLMSADLSKSTYQAILKAFYGFIFPAETSYYTQLTAIIPRVVTYTRSHLLKQDLLFSGLTETEIDHLPLFKHDEGVTKPEMMGCLYVLEGSKLGGQMISKHVKQTLGFDNEKGTLFFSAHGKETGYYWKEFIELFTQYAVNTKQEDTVISAAKKTFTDFKDWLNSYNVSI